MLKINTLRAAIEKANTWCRANPEAWTVFVEEGGIETTGETPSFMYRYSLVLFVMNYAGSIDDFTLPLMASATATFLFRQFFMTLPDELIEAARIDGASPMRFFRDIVLPLSKTNLAALFVITFIYGWNQYLWPLLIITDVNLGTAVAGIKGMIAIGQGTTQWNQVMAAMLLTLIPPVVIVLAMQRAFVRGLVDSEK